MTSAEQTASIKKSMQDEKAAKDEVIRELAEALLPFSIWSEEIDTEPNGYAWKDEDSIIRGLKMKDFRRARAALRKAGAL